MIIKRAKRKAVEVPTVKTVDLQRVVEDMVDDNSTHSEDTKELKLN